MVLILLSLCRKGRWLRLKFLWRRRRRSQWRIRV
jgi:hypothetical protein